MRYLDQRNPNSDRPSNANHRVTPHSPMSSSTGRRRLHSDPIVNWVLQVIGLRRIKVQVRVRGNNLHILCEGPQSPHQATIVNRMIYALAKVDLARLLPKDQPQIYQVFLYGRAFGSERPTWSKQILLNQLDRYLVQLKLASIQQKQAPSPGLPSVTSQPEQPHPKPLHQFIQAPPAPPPNLAPQAASPSISLPPLPAEPAANQVIETGSPSLSAPEEGIDSSALVVSNRSLARQGKADAIARFLSETLGAMGVSVQVKVEVRQRRTDDKKPDIPSSPTLDEVDLTGSPVDPSQTRRLCIYCESAYSPEHSILAEKIAAQLRDLNLEGFRDAVIFSQVQGESQPEWALRVDLTPPEKMLKHLARWGDVEAIARLVNQILDPYRIEAVISIKQLTLHIFCKFQPQPKASQPKASQQETEPGAVPDQASTIDLISPFLERLAPQGIYAAFVYGQVDDQHKPAWVEWFKLPASVHTALSESPQELAKQGDQPALSFLLTRLLNPDLDRQLATGGVRVQIIHRESLLHVMTDAPVCPNQADVGTAIAKQVHHLNIPGVQGVRVYGRRAGEKRPAWKYGKDFVSPERLTPEAVPEFAASDAHVSELLTQPSSIVLRRDIMPDEVNTVTELLVYRLVRALQSGLERTQLFISNTQLLESNHASGGKTALVWGIAGVMMLAMMDLVMGQVLQRHALMTRLLNQQNPPSTSTVQTRPRSKGSSPSVASSRQFPSNQTQPLNQDQPVDHTNFTQGGSSSLSLTSPSDFQDDPLADQTKPFTPSRGLYEVELQDSPYEDFGNPQLNKKLALYYERLRESGPPDVLIVGSSRALRGVDPVALKQALAEQGYQEATIFNFGINGATAQVVDVLLRKILLPEQLPKVILWADGARAFNSGRSDNTYEAIANSKGYQLLAQGQPALSPEALAQLKLNTVNQAPNKIAKPFVSLTQRYQNTNEKLSETIATLSATYPQRTELKSWLRDRLNTVVPQQPLTTLTDPLLASDLSQEDQTSLLQTDFDGFLSLSVQFNPATYYQKYARVAGDFDSDYQSFRLEGSQTQALQTLLEFTRSQKINLIFVNLPLTGEYLDPVRRGYEQEFQQFMLQTASQNSLFFRDLSGLWPAENTYFSDPSHLNRYGAYAVSRQLAKDPLIAWEAIHSPSQPSNE